MSWALISNFGSVYALLVTPALFVISAVTWFFLGALQFSPSSSTKSSYLAQVGHGKFLGSCILVGSGNFRVLI